MRHNVLGQADKANMVLFGERGRKESLRNRALLAVALRNSDKQEMRNFAERLYNPDTMDASVGRIAEQMQIPIMDLAKEYRTIAEAYGIIRMSDHLPDLMEQSAVQARQELVICPVCEGQKKVVANSETGETKVCTGCRGKGKINVGGGKDELELVFKLAKLLGEKNPLLNVDLRHMPKTENMADLYKTIEGVTGQ